MARVLKHTGQCASPWNRRLSICMGERTRAS
jgi:hypothetical protein